MRYLLVMVAMLMTGFVGGILGWLAGVAMDRFRWLGLGPEEFWRTDPENVCAWGLIIGGLAGMAAGLAVSLIFAVVPAAKIEQLPPPAPMAKRDPNGES